MTQSVVTALCVLISMEAVIYGLQIPNLTAFALFLQQ